MQETQVQSLGQEDPLEQEMAPHSSILAWRIQWTEEPGVLQPTGSRRVAHDWDTNTSTLWTLLTSLLSYRPGCPAEPWFSPSEYASHGVAQSQTQLKRLSSSSSSKPTMSRVSNWNSHFPSWINFSSGLPPSCSWLHRPNASNWRIRGPSTSHHSPSGKSVLLTDFFLLESATTDLILAPIYHHFVSDPWLRSSKTVVK